MEYKTKKPYNDFVRTEHIYHDGAKYMGCFSLRYHLYNVAPATSRKDGIVHACIWSGCITEPGEGSRSDRASTKGGNADVTMNDTAVREYMGPHLEKSCTLPIYHATVQRQ